LSLNERRASGLTFDTSAITHCACGSSFAFFAKSATQILISDGDGDGLAIEF
jgi:hypothetical protein